MARWKNGCSFCNKPCHNIYRGIHKRAAHSYDSVVMQFMDLPMMTANRPICFMFIKTVRACWNSMCGYVKSGYSQTFCMYMHCIAVCVCLFAVILTWRVCESNRINEEKLRRMANTSDAAFSEQNPKLHPQWRIIIIIRDGKISKSHDTMTWWFHDMIFIVNFF